MTKFAAGLLIATLCASFSANAARPSFTSLQQQINQLKAENNAQQAQIDAITADEEKIPEPGQALYVDANDVMLGELQTSVGNPDNARIYFKVNERFYIAGINYSYINNVTSLGFWEGNLFYDQPGCTGNVYSRGSFIYPVYQFIPGVREGVLYIPDSDTPQTVTVMSEWYENWAEFNDFTELGPGCADTDVPEGVVVEWTYPAVPIIDTNIYTKPFRLKLTPPN